MSQTIESIFPVLPFLITFITSWLTVTPCTKEDGPCWCQTDFLSKPHQSFHLHVFICFTSTVVSLFFFIIAFSLFLLGRISGVCVCFMLVIHRVQLFATLWTTAQAPFVHGASLKKEYWSGLPCPSSTGSLL